MKDYLHSRVSSSLQLLGSEFIKAAAIYQNMYIPNQTGWEKWMSWGFEPGNPAERDKKKLQIQLKNQAESQLHYHLGRVEGEWNSLIEELKRYEVGNKEFYSNLKDYVNAVTEEITRVETSSPGYKRKKLTQESHAIQYPMVMRGLSGLETMLHTAIDVAFP